MYESTIAEVPAIDPGGPVPTPGPLTSASSMTVRSNDLYVAEALEGGGLRARTDQFAPSASSPGEYGFVAQLPPQAEPGNSLYAGIGFGSASGEEEMYIGQRESPPGVDVFSAGLCGKLECATLQTLWTGAGAPHPLDTLTYIAVDHSSGTGTSAGDWASGDVFAAEEFANPTSPAIDIFEPQAGGGEHYVGQVTGLSSSEPFKELRSIAVSSVNGDLIVGAALGGGNAAVYVFQPQQEGLKTGKYVPAQTLMPPGGSFRRLTAVAVDDGNGEIYVDTATAVYEFGPEGSFRGEIAGVPKEGIPTGVKGQGEEVRFNEDTARPVSLAVDPESHRLFVGVFGSQVGPKGENLAVVDAFGPDVVVPDVEARGPFDLELETDGSGAHSWSVLATGTVNPDSAGEATCWFVWGTSEQTLNKEAQCGEAIASSSKQSPVDASLNGLTPDTTYYYRLEARNGQGTNLGEESQDYEFTTPGPGLESESASAVFSSSAKLKATIAPHDAPQYQTSASERRRDFQESTKTPTTFFFQYSQESTEGCGVKPLSCTDVPVAPTSAGAGVAGVEVEEDVSKLIPSTTYHYRIVAMNEALPEVVPGGVIPVAEPGVQIAFYGPDHTFTTQGAGKPSALPDGRVWELVSPADKHGARIEGGAQTALDGGKLAFVTGTPSTPSTSGYDGNGSQVLASRTAPGVWSSVDISLSHSSPVGILAGVPPEYRFFSEDLSLAIVESQGPFSVPRGWHKNQRGEWEEVIESYPMPTERTPYLRHNATCESHWSTCYEPLLDAEDTQGGEPHEGDPEAGEDLANIAGATPDGSHAVIGSPVRLTATAAPAGGLYEWSADKPANEKLSLVSVLPDGTAAGGVGTQRRASGLLALSNDGSRLVFGVGGQQSDVKVYWQELYLRDESSGETVPLGSNESGSPAGGVKLFQAASADGSKSFFTDTEALTKGAGTGTIEHGSDLYLCEVDISPLRCVLRDLTLIPEAGQPGAHEDARVSRVLNISRDGNYVYFIASGVQATGATAGRENLYVAHEQEGVWTTTFVASSSSGMDKASAVSPDGQWFAFSSEASLTGYDNHDVKTGLPDSEVYLYDAATAKLTCVSCDPSGARPIGSAEVPGSRSLFNSGRLFFDSGDALVGQDTNGNVDVYEFEPPKAQAGVGSCSSGAPIFDVAADGCVGLISSGVAFGPSLFVEASGTGGDVFFTTAERLVPEDSDTAVDMYDAHECSASAPCRPSPKPPIGECGSTTTCRAASTPQPPIFGAPSSATFSGTGNVTPSGPPEPPQLTPEQIRKKKLEKALKACRKNRSKGKRVTCERQARARYAVKSSKAGMYRLAAPGRRRK